MSFLAHSFAGGIVGAYLLSWLWGDYQDAVDDQTSGGVEEAGVGILIIFWILYVS